MRFLIVIVKYNKENVLKKITFTEKYIFVQLTHYKGARRKCRIFTFIVLYLKHTHTHSYISVYN